MKSSECTLYRHCCLRYDLLFRLVYPNLPISPPTTRTSTFFRYRRQKLLETFQARVVKAVRARSQHLPSTRGVRFKLFSTNRARGILPGPRFRAVSDLFPGQSFPVFGVSRVVFVVLTATGKHRRGRRQRIRLEHGRRDRHVDKRAAAPPSQISSSSPSRRHRLPSKSLLLLKVFACIFGRVNSTKKEGKKRDIHI